MPTSKSEQRSHRARKLHQPAAAPPPAPATRDDDAPVWGAKAIGAVINRTESQTFHLLESRALKGARKVNGKWSAIPSVLRALWERTSDA